MVHDLVCGRLPLLLIEHLDGNDVSLNGSVHVLASNKQDWLVESGNRNTPLYPGKIPDTMLTLITDLEVVILVSIEVPLMELT